MKKGNNVLKLTLFLAVIAALATGLLALVNQMTYPVIEANAGSKETQAYKDLYPDAKSIEKVEFTADADGHVLEAYKIDDTAYAFKATGQGYAAPITFILGYNVDGSNAKFKMLQINDTPGYGMKLNETAYSEEYAGKTTSDSIPVVSGATDSSNGVKTAANAVISVFNSLTGNTGGPVDEPKDDRLVLSEYTEGTIVDKKVEGNLTTFTATGEGFEGINKFDVVVNTETMRVEAITVVEFINSDDYGTSAGEQAYLDTFIGFSLKGSEVKADASSGATVDSKSLMHVLNAIAIDLGADKLEPEKEPEFKTSEFTDGTATLTNEEGSLLTFEATAEGFEGDNTFKIVLNIDTKTVDSISIVEFVNSDEYGTPASEEAYLDSFKGISFASGSAGVDAASGATVDSKSIFHALNAAIELAVEKIGG